jgi:hypothetical protein
MFDFEKLDVYKKAKAFNSKIGEFLKTTKLDTSTNDQPIPTGLTFSNEYRSCGSVYNKKPVAVGMPLIFIVADATTTSTQADAPIPMMYGKDRCKLVIIHHNFCDIPLLPTSVIRRHYIAERLPQSNPVAFRCSNTPDRGDKNEPNHF